MNTTRERGAIMEASRIGNNAVVSCGLYERCVLAMLLAKACQPRRSFGGYGSIRRAHYAAG